MVPRNGKNSSVCADTTHSAFIDGKSSSAVATSRDQVKTGGMFPTLTSLEL